MILRRASVAAVLAAALVAVTTALLALLGLVNYASQRDRGWARLREDLALHAAQLAVGLELPIWNIDRQQIDRVLDGLQDAPEIQAVVVEAAGRTHARVRDEHGRLVTLVGPPPTAGLLVERRPISVNGEFVGSLAIHASPRILEQDLREARTAIVSTIVAVDLLLVLSLYLVVWQTVLKPLRMIERYAGAVRSRASGEVARMAGPGFLGELESLRGSIEDMVRLLDLRCTELGEEVASRQESERKARGIFDLSFGFIGLLTPDGTLIEANRTALEFVGVGLADVSGKPFWETPWWSHAPEAQTQIREAVKVAASGRLVRGETTHLDKDGRLRIVDFTLKPVLDQHGRVTWLIPEGRDITERKRAEEALAASEERYRLLFEGNPIPMLVYNLDNLRFLALNEAAVRQYGWSRAELEQLSVPDLAVPDDEQLAEFLATRLNPRPDLVHVGARRQRRRDGTLIEVDMTSLCITFSGQPARLLLLRDITAERQVAEERARLEDSARSNERMSAMGALVAGVAHEVRTPLFSISATVDALEAELAGRQEFAELAGLLRAQVARLSRLMHDLLDYGKPPVPRMAPAELVDVVRRALRACAPLAHTQGVELVEEIPAELPVLSIDAGRIEQVLDNLIANALQHSPRGGRVRLAARLVGGPAVELRVEDEGWGIEASDLPRLFEPFFSRRARGTGLGLPIVQGIVEAHGGNVTAANRDGRGAVFTVRLPVSPPRGEHAR